jgi:DNA-binding NarL/FixJ family response regulator
MNAQKHPISVLIADKDENLRSALTLLLTNEYSMLAIIEAESEESLHDAARTDNHDLVIIDWNFYRRGASALIQRYRERQPGTIFIVLSKHPEDKMSALAAGAHAFISKGDPPEYLHDTLMKFINVAAEKIGIKPSMMAPYPKPIYCHYLV